MKFIKNILSIFTLFMALNVDAQNALYIPPSLTGTVFNLNIQAGSTIFYNNTNTPTYGINGVWMAPTIIVNKGDSITLNVKNNLPVKTTMHWHGLHVAPQNDGGPHQIINPTSTWSPSFKIRNNAATFWYHPHGNGQTDPQVSKGIAGFLIVKDSNEAKLNLPRNYGVDDFPINIQSKAFDELKQISIATDMDTAIFVNGTLYPYLNAHAQVIRLRLLNGSSLRSYNFGFSNSQIFYLIGVDGGLLDSSIALKKLRLSPGERAEILINLNGMMGQTIFLKSYSSELESGIYGADSIGNANNQVEDYENNPLNGANFNVLQLNIVAESINAIKNIPSILIPYMPLNIASATKSRTLIFDTFRLLPADVPNLADGPFGINNKSFDMDVINETVYLNTTETWTLINHTLVAHPFHIHDVQFNVLEKSGKPVTISERGWKDVVLVMPNDSIKFITKFETFANSTVPYMYHCHLLHHEDDGMMGSFLVIDTTSSTGINQNQNNTLQIIAYPNPSNDIWSIEGSTTRIINSAELIDVLGRTIFSFTPKQTGNTFSFQINNTSLHEGMYFLKINSNGSTQAIHLMKN